MNVDIGKSFFNKLLNRNEFQGDGTFTAIDFRNKFLLELEKDSSWEDKNFHIVLDFSNVEIIGPSWANEVFAYYLGRGLKKSKILEKLICTNLTKTKEMIINKELDEGYRG